MITLKRSIERRRTLDRGQETWQSFDADEPFDPAHDGFRSLECFREEELAPGAGFQFRASRNLEILTYVWKGSMDLVDPKGQGVRLETGECHRYAAKAGTLNGGVNVSRTESARVFQGFITPDRTKIQMPAEKRRFSLAERRGILRLVVSRSGRDSSLRLSQDARVYSSILDPGHHLVHELIAGRGAWLHVVKGRVQLLDQMLESGDGAAVVGEAALSFTAQEASEILLFDLV